MELYTVMRKSGETAEADPIVLRATETTRLVFKPLLVNNAQDADAPIKGTFVFQKKRKNESWEDYDTMPLSSLKSEEGFKLELKSGELHDLLRHAAALYRLYKKQGLPKGKVHFIKVATDQDNVHDLSQLNVSRLLKIMQRVGTTAVSEIFEWIANLENANEVIEHLARLEINGLKRINSLVGISTLRSLLQLWEENQTNHSEEFWQRIFQQYSFVLAQLFAYPVVLFKGKAYVGGKSLENTGGHLVDFLFANQLTRNAVLVEIKTPATRLLGKEYRGGVYSMSDELSGSVSQVLTYRQSLLQEINHLASRSGDVEAYSPRCMVLMGHAGNELSNAEKAKSFELLRGAFNADVVVLTYDEVFAKAKALLEIMEGTEGTSDTTK